MFKKTKSKTNVNCGSKESLSGNQTSSNENLPDSLERFAAATSIYQTSHFDIYFLGLIQDVNLGGAHSRDPDVQLIDKVEEAQLEGKVRLVPKQADLVTVTISKHGMKVLSLMKREVLQRHPLHTVAQIVYYTDSFFKSNLAVKVGQVGRAVYDCYVFQCHNEDEAQAVCQSLKDVYNVITNHTV